MAARKKLPDAKQESKKIPESTMESKPMPAVGNPENTVMIGGVPIEIKATKLKYQRNRTALFYKMLELYPIAEIMGYDVGTFDEERDGDKCIMDFLIAATDNEKLVTDNYDEMDTDTIEKILSIFRRVNRINEKEENQKKMEAKRKAMA